MKLEAIEKYEIIANFLNLLVLMCKARAGSLLFNILARTTRNTGYRLTARTLGVKARRDLKRKRGTVYTHGEFSVTFSSSSDMDDFAGAGALVLCALAHYNVVTRKVQKRKKRPRRWWMLQIHRNRTSLGMQHQLGDLVAETGEEFKKFTRMSKVDFEFLLNEIYSQISKKDTQLRPAIPAGVRLAITLRYLASGDSYQSLHFLFKVSPQSISSIIPEVCEALNNVLRKEIQIPSSAEEWLEIESGFKPKFPRAIGAIDGKHINVICPPNSGSEFFNYKKYFSIVLMVVVDSNYKFIFADVGGQGRISDGGIFRNTVFWDMISNDSLNLPAPHPLRDSNMDVPYVFLGDGAFALHPNIMKPYPGNHNANSPERIFNKKLSGARVIVENTFGILASRFRIFRSPIELSPEKASVITITCILLHNYLIRSNTSSQIYFPEGTVDTYDNNDNLIQPGSWRRQITTSAIQNIPRVARRATANANQVRDEFKNYFFNTMS